MTPFGVKKIAKDIAREFSATLPKNVLVIAEPFYQCFDIEMLYRIAMAVKEIGIRDVLLLWWTAAGTKPRVFFKVDGIQELLRINLRNIKKIEKAMRKELRSLLPLWNELAEFDSVGVRIQWLHNKEVRVIEEILSVTLYQQFFDEAVKEFTKRLYEAVRHDEIVLKRIPVKTRDGEIVEIDPEHDELPESAQLANNRSGGLVYLLLAELVKAIDGVLVEGEMRNDALEIEWYEATGIRVFWVLKRPTEMTRPTKFRDLMVVQDALAFSKIRGTVQAEDFSVLSMAFSEDAKEFIRETLKRQKVF